MFAKILMVFRIPELRQKILLTLILLAVYRMGYHIPLPIVDQDKLRSTLEQMQQGGDGEGGIGHVLQVVQLFSAAQYGMSTIFGLGIMPYISTSIIFQLLASVYPPLEKLQKEGEAGRRKINEYTRYATVVLCLIQSFFWVRMYLGPNGFIQPEFNNLQHHLLAAFTMTAGTILLMWIGEQIDEFGIGNGISLIIMAGILARMPEAIYSLLQPALTKGIALGTDAGIDKLLVLSILFVAVILGVVAITRGERRIPTQSAKHVRGRRVYGGQRQWLPLRVNQAGVMPIIFASSLLMFPQMGLSVLAQGFPDVAFFRTASQAFGSDRGFVYNVSYIALIYFFCYFWTAITFNPQDMANNLKDYGSFIPGYRPGKRTADYLEKVMVRITYVGAAFLATIAVIPTVISEFLSINYMVASFFGGTGLLIIVSVALDLVQKIDSHLVMRNYSGLLEDD